MDDPRGTSDMKTGMLIAAAFAAASFGAFADFDINVDLGANPGATRSSCASG